MTDWTHHMRRGDFAYAPSLKAIGAHVIVVRAAGDWAAVIDDVAHALHTFTLD